MQRVQDFVFAQNVLHSKPPFVRLFCHPQDPVSCVLVARVRSTEAMLVYVLCGLVGNLRQGAAIVYCSFQEACGRCGL